MNANADVGFELSLVFGMDNMTTGFTRLGILLAVHLIIGKKLICSEISIGSLLVNYFGHVQMMMLCHIGYIYILGIIHEILWCLYCLKDCCSLTLTEVMCAC